MTSAPISLATAHTTGVGVGAAILCDLSLEGEGVPVSLFSESTACLGSTGPKSGRGTSGDVS